MEIILQQNVVILSVSKWDFKNDENEQLKGTTVWYIDETPTNEEKTKGCLPVKASMDYATFSDINIISKGVYPFKATADVKVDLTRGKHKVVNFYERTTK